jgi:NADPH:quinone reductase-like Zn-dependent oxidoreductase
MKAVQIPESGGRDVIEYGEYPDPEVGADEVLVDVKAAALNHMDVRVRRGLPGVDHDLPRVPGSDGAGVVQAVGADVSRFSVGDRVALWAGVSCGDCEFCRDGDPSLCVDFHIIGEHVDGVESEYAADIGAETWRDSLASLAKGGRVLTVGATTGGRPETDLNRIFWNQLSVIGSTMATPGEVDRVLDLVWAGTLEPGIRETLPMSRAADAQRLIEDREGFGKVVLVPDSEYDG